MDGEYIWITHFHLSLSHVIFLGGAKYHGYLVWDGGIMPRRKVTLFLCFLSIRRPADYMHAVNISAVIFRFMKYATRERKNGRVPFIDPFSTNPCRQVYGMSNLAEVT